MITMLAHPPPLNIAILAAGKSHRLGASKPLARLHGQSLLLRTARLVSRLNGRCFVVIPPNAARLRLELQGLEVTLLENHKRAEGLSSSVRLAVAHAHAAAGVLLLPVDLPELRYRELLRLVNFWRGAPQCVVARRVEDGPAIPLILPKWLYPKAETLSGDFGLKAVLDDLPADRLRLADLPSAARDIDTREELNAAQRRFRVPKG